MSISKVSKSVLSGYDLQKVEKSLGECEDGVGVCVGGLQICSPGEGTATPYLESDKSREIGTSFAPFSRDTNHVQIITDREASSDDDEESGDEGSEGNLSRPPVSETSWGDGGRLRREPLLEHPRVSGREVPNMSKREKPYEDLYCRFPRGQPQGVSSSELSSDLQKAKRDEILQLFDELTPSGKNTDSQCSGIRDLGFQKSNPDEKFEAARQYASVSKSGIGRESESISANNGSHTISFSVDQHLNAPIWVRHDQLISLIEQLASLGGFSVMIESESLNLVPKKNQLDTTPKLLETPEPKHYSITWGDFQQKLKEGFTFPLRGGKGVAVINASSYGLGAVEEKQIEIGLQDSEKDLLIKCLKVRGLYDYMMRKLDFN